LLEEFVVVIGLIVVKAFLVSFLEFFFGFPKKEIFLKFMVDGKEFF
jgi:hypothetical protein